MVNVNGHLMHINCLGEGSPTVILETGAGTGGATLFWQDIHEAAAKFTRVCAYDRAGVGYSEPVDKLTRAEDVVTNLSILLEAYDIDDDLVLVGWSRGGVYTRRFQARFPEKVAGLVFVDSSHELQYQRVPPAPIQIPAIGPLYKIAQYLQPIGLLRITGLAEGQIQNFAIPAREMPRATALYNLSHAPSTLINEMQGAMTDRATTEPPQSLGDLPLVVITQGAPVVLPPGLPDAYTLKYFQDTRRVWNELQRELTELSSNSKQVIAELSGHADIHDKQPDLLLEAIAHVVSAIKEY